MALRIALILALAMTLTTTGCAFVKRTAEGEKVRVLAADEVTTCRKLGQTSSSVLASIAGIDRPEETITEELRTLGRNSAAEMGGDTIVNASEIENGKQSFNVYKCVDPNAP